MPVSYQNLLDGAIKFTFSDGHGGTQTLTPSAYDPNNDLYISADQGGFEITNVHPGTNVYYELNLVGNWGGSGNSLIGLTVAGGPRIIGIQSFYTWPRVNSVSHNDVSEVIKVYLNDKESPSKITLTDKNGVSEDFAGVDGVIEIPTSKTSNAIDRHVNLTLSVDNNVISSLIFLPRQESEPFTNGHYVKDDGGTGDSLFYDMSDYIDVSMAQEYVYSGKSVNPIVACIYAYDENRRPLRMILNTSDNLDPVHFVPDGTYTYIRCTYERNTGGSLIVYYRDRRR